MSKSKNIDIGFALFLIGITLVFGGFLIQELISINIGFYVSLFGVIFGGVGVVTAFVLIVSNWLEKPGSDSDSD